MISLPDKDIISPMTGKTIHGFLRPLRSLHPPANNITIMGNIDAGKRR